MVKPSEESLKIKTKQPKGCQGYNNRKRKETEMKTYEIKNERKWLAIWEALNDTTISFASYAYKCITVFDDAKAEELEKQMKACRIGFEEV